MDTSTNKLGLKMQRVTREEVEARRVDATRFQHPAMYQTQEELNYFRDPKKREEFITKYFKGKL